jgi:Type IV secretion system pilin
VVSLGVMQKYLVALGVMACLFIVPMSVGAADLVTCGGPNDEACNTCDAVIIINNVISWLVMILGTIAAILIVVAGARLVTSAGNTSAKEAAKSSITNLIIGYLIVLSAWLVLDYGLKALLIQDGTYSFGVWNQVSCIAETDAGFRQVDQIPVEWIEYTPPPTGTYVDPIMTGGGPTGGAYPPDMSAGGSCSSALISPHFGSQTGNAQCIIRAESACGASMVSRSDVMYNDPGRRAFSFGPMQINLTVHVLQGCAGYPATLDCKSAFSGRNYTARVINESLYQQCARAAQNPSCNIRNGARIYREAGNSWRPWSTAEGCGLR